jgi:hypothetical protein
MDPVTAIVTALALGAGAGLKETAETAVKDAYAGLKGLIHSKHEKVDLRPLEEAPGSKARQAVVAEDLNTSHAGEDADVLRQAKVLLDVIRERDPRAGESIGVDLSDIEGASLRIADVVASGAGVRARGARISGDIEITGVRAGQAAAEAPPKKN